MIAILLAMALPAQAEAPLTSDAINSATFAGWTPAESATEPDPFLVRAQVLLERARVSPGVVDGFAGDNMAKAVRVFEEQNGLPADGELDAEVWTALADDAAPAVEVYTITEKDLEARFVDEIPEDYGVMAKMEWLGYRSPTEMLAERFHMDEDLLKALNPNADFNSAGTKILVAAPAPAIDGEVSRIEVSRASGQLWAYAPSGDLVVAYPASVGSTQTPSPSGTHEVRTVAMEPTYAYRPDVNFQQGSNDKALTIPPGPNGPVGSVWIDLSEPTYGIHGTSDPALINKASSHGCVRLANWHAEELAGLVKAGTTVKFID